MGSLLEVWKVLVVLKVWDEGAESAGGVDGVEGAGCVGGGA